MSFLCVAAGGAVGAALRYAVSLITYKGGFPLLTFVTNLLGAVAIGFIAGAASRKDVSKNTLLFLKTGLCGGFTTFSTFSLEAYQLLEGGPKVMACVYIALSVVCCIAGVWCGMALSKQLG